MKVERSGSSIVKDVIVNRNGRIYAVNILLKEKVVPPVKISEDGKTVKIVVDGKDRVLLKDIGETGSICIFRDQRLGEIMVTVINLRVMV